MCIVFTGWLKIHRNYFNDVDHYNIYLQAIANNGWTEPTLVQERGIPILLEGKDMLVRARTGSGKTAAFVIPVIQKILEYKEVKLL